MTEEAMTTNHEDELRELAKDRLKKRRDLGSHLVGLVLNVWDVYFRRPVTEHDIQSEIERMKR